MSYRFLIIFFIALILPKLGLGFDDEDSFTFRYKVYGLHPGDYSEIQVLAGESQPEAIKFKPKSRSTTYEATLPISEPYLTFVRKLDGSAKSQNFTYQKVAITPIPSDWNDVLIIFNKEKTRDQPEGYTTVAIDDSLGTFPQSSIRVLNMTGIDVLAQIGEDRSELNKGTCSQAQVFTTEKAPVSIAAEGETQYHLLYRNKLRIGSKSRALLVLRPPIRSGSIKIGGHLLRESMSEEFQ